MVICAVVAECGAWYQIEHYCKSKKEWFKKKLKLKLKNGVPSHDTFERVFAMIDPKEFQAGFHVWVQETVDSIRGETVSIDGKTIRASRDDERRAVHMVSAWANKQKLVLRQVKTAEKSNEITAIPQLLDMLEIEGSVITVDAMGCQKEITKKITEKKADYVLGLKENQQTLFNDVKLYFDENCCREKATTNDKGHNKFAKSTREHWGIENSLHWVLDVAFNEDNCRMRKDNSGENFAVIISKFENRLNDFQSTARTPCDRQRRSDLIA